MNTSASDLERVLSDLSQIARTYTNASQELEQKVITLEGQSRTSSPVV